MKNLFFLAVLFSVSTLFAQKFSIKSDNGNIFYLDRSHTVKVKVEGYDSSKILATASKLGIITGQDGIYTVNLDEGHLSQRNVGDSIIISVFVEKEDGYYLLGGKTFFVARKNNLEMGLDNFRSGDKINLTQLYSIQKMAVTNDDAFTEKEGKGYKVISYECMLVPYKGNPEALSCKGDILSNQIKEIASRINPDRILIDDIVLQNENGDKKLGSRITLIISEKRGTYLHPFSEKDSYTINELLNINTLTAEIGPDAPLAGTIYPISSYDVLLVPKVGITGAFTLNNNQFSDDIKSNIKQTLKPGDKILFDNISYIKPNGTFGMCPPVRIFVK